MRLQLKTRIGVILVVFGCLLAIVGEILNAQTADVLSASWHTSLNLIILGTFILLIGLPLLPVSDLINGFGLLGSYLLFIGGLLLIIGTIVLDWILLPFLINLANTMSSVINVPAGATQRELNTIIANLNNAGGSAIQKLFPGITTTIPAVHIPKANGIAMVNQALTQLHIPTIDRLQWWGHLSLTGGTLIVGCLVMGLALLYKYRALLSTGSLLIIVALFNLLCQLIPVLPPYCANFTAVLLFLALAWWAVSAWIAEPATAVYVH